MSDFKMQPAGHHILPTLDMPATGKGVILM